MKKPVIKMVENRTATRGPASYSVEVQMDANTIRLDCKSELHAQVVSDALRQCPNIRAVI